MGRPPKREEERADALIQFRIRKDEKAALKQAAEADGKKLSAWIKDALLRLAERSTPRRRKKP